MAALFTFNLFGSQIEISHAIYQQWGIIIFVAFVLLILTRKLDVVPKRKKQIVIEMIVEGVNGWVTNTMGKKYILYAPYIAALTIFLFFMNTADLIGLHPSTGNYSVALALALSTFAIIQINAIVKNGFFGYLKGYLHGSPYLLPMNLLERVMLPVTLSLRLFGNITVGTVIIELLLEALRNLASVLQIAIPVPFMAYFNLFDGALQSFIFVVLTMIYIKMTAED